MRTFNALNKLDFTIVILWGEQNKPEKMEIWYPFSGERKTENNCTIKDTRYFISKWYKWAHENNKSKFGPENPIEIEIPKFRRKLPKPYQRTIFEQINN